MSEKLEYNQVSERLDLVNRKVIEYRAKHDQIKSRLEEIKKEAKEQYGVNSIEELRELLIQTRKEEEEELNKADKEIKEAEEKLSKIKEELEKLN